MCDYRWSRLSEPRQSRLLKLYSARGPEDIQLKIKGRIVDRLEQLGMDTRGLPDHITMSNIAETMTQTDRGLDEFQP